MINVVKTEIPDVLIIEPTVFKDDRGFFLESYNKRDMERAGINAVFVQDNHVRSIKNVLRGLHYQVSQSQGKLIRVMSGEIFDVAVDIRRSSATFGKWVGINISDDNKKIVWIPPCFAHGYLVLSKCADVLYKTTDFYAPQHERCIRWNDPEIKIKWPFKGTPIISSKDMLGNILSEAEIFP